MLTRPQKIPILGKHFIREIPASDNVSMPARSRARQLLTGLTAVLKRGASRRLEEAWVLALGVEGFGETLSLGLCEACIKRSIYRRLHRPIRSPS